MLSGRGITANRSWYRITKENALSYSIKISAVCSLVLSRCTRVMDGRIDRQYYVSQDRASIAALLRRVVKIKYATESTTNGDFS